MPRIVRSPQAKRDVLNIGRSLAVRSQSTGVAVRFLDRIDEKLKFLARHPFAGEARPDLSASIRCFPVQN